MTIRSENKTAKRDSSDCLCQTETESKNERNILFEWKNCLLYSNFHIKQRLEIKSKWIPASIYAASSFSVYMTFESYLYAGPSRGVSVVFGICWFQRRFETRGAEERWCGGQDGCSLMNELIECAWPRVMRRAIALSTNDDEDERGLATANFLGYILYAIPWHGLTFDWLWRRRFNDRMTVTQRRRSGGGACGWWRNAYLLWCADLHFATEIWER